MGNTRAAVKPAVTVDRWSNHRSGFYSLLGPYLSRREIADELGAPVWDDDGKTWYVATAGRGQVAGFCAALATGEDRARYQSDYVLPAWRDRGVYEALFTARDAEWSGCEIEAVVAAAAQPLYRAAGFEVVRPRGRYALMRRRPS